LVGCIMEREGGAMESDSHGICVTRRGITGWLKITAGKAGHHNYTLHSLRDYSWLWCSMYEYLYWDASDNN